MTPSAKILSKALISSGLDSREATYVAASLRDRAFFSAKVESVRFLQDVRKSIADYLQKTVKPDGTYATRADAISGIMRRASDSGLSAGEGGITDLGSAVRAKVIADTNAGLAAGYCARRAQGTRGARLAYPGLMLIRVEDRKEKRDWMSRWNIARSSLGDASTATPAMTATGPFVALKEDPIWAAISHFGTPYPPFDFNSGMGVEEVSFDECKALGIVADDYEPEGNLDESFNRTMEAECAFKGESDPTWQWLKASFGDQIAQYGGKVVWQAEMLRGIKSGSVDITDTTRITADTVNRILNGNISQHELDLIPHMVRSEDGISDGDRAVRTMRDAADSGTYRLLARLEDDGRETIYDFSYIPDV